MSDLISRQAVTGICNSAIDLWHGQLGEGALVAVKEGIEGLPSVEPEIIRCKDCKFYIPMNRKTKTGICSLTMHQNFGYDWFCAGAKKRVDMRGEQDDYR